MPASESVECCHEGCTNTVPPNRPWQMRLRLCRAHYQSLNYLADRLVTQSEVENARLVIWHRVGMTSEKRRRKPWPKT